MDNIFTSLNDPQKLAVKIIDKPLLILAGAGSGKTRVITYKIAYLLNFFNPSSILALTFTNKAADEMKERVFSLVGLKKDLIVSTFHSFGYRFLKEEIDKIGYNKNFVIYSEEDKEWLIHSILTEMKLDIEYYNYKKIGKIFSLIKNRFIDIKDLSSNLKDETLFKVYIKYTETLKNFNAIDLDDLIHLPVYILTNNKEINEKWNKRIDYILVDEYQDTNYLQYLLIRLLSKGKERLCVVGDDDQSIYAFRGATIDNILRFEKDFPGAQKIVLNINYRNNPIILKASYSLIKNNSQRYNKSIITYNKRENKIHFFEGIDREDEAKWIAKNIFKNRIDKIPYSKQAILCRTNYQIKYIEPILRKENIPYKVIGATSFFDKKEIKDILAYLRIINNPRDNLSLLRAINIPKRNIGEKTIEIIKFYSKDKPLYETLKKIDEIEEINQNTKSIIKDFIKKIEYYEEKFSSTISIKDTTEELIEEIDYYSYLKIMYKEKELENRIKSINFFLNYIEKIKIEKDENNPLTKFLITLALLNNDDHEKNNEDKVNLMTIHAAKGLEFDVVFIPGFEEGILPHQNSIDENNIEEERRLTYVAFTRAKEKLYISYSMSCNNKQNQISRFISEIDQELFDGLYKEEEESNFYLQRIRDILS